MIRYFTGKFNTVKQSTQKGFTLIELIVTLALLTIILGIGTFGIFGWIDWSTFKKENSAAEEIFYAAQNQLTELDSSGALYRRVTSVLESESDYNARILLAKGTDTFEMGPFFTSLKASNGDSYDWSEIWYNQNDNKEPRTIVRLTVGKGAFSDYSNGVAVDESARILFELVGPYISDKSILDGAITLEFSPEAGQVLAVCYSDKADELTYESDTSTTKVLSVLNREIHVRQSIKLGYYGVDTMTAKIKGRGKLAKDSTLELENGAALIMSLHKINFDFNNMDDDDEVEFIIKGSATYDGSYIPVMKFTVKKSDFDGGVIPTDIVSASKKPVRLTDVLLYDGLYNPDKDSSGVEKDFRFPVWVEDEKLCVALDAVDIQAQSITYAEANGLISTLPQQAVTDAQNNFRNTYSFYRFGLDNVNYIRPEADLTIAEVESHADGQRHGAIDGVYGPENNAIHGERTTFANDDGIVAFTDAEGTDIKSKYFVKNSRHLYNIRFESDYDTPVTNSSTGKKEEISKTFVLRDNVDWNDLLKFKKNNGTEMNYLLNSRDSNGVIISGIDFDGIINTEIQYGNETDKLAFPFPGFRKLSKEDNFIQEHGFDATKINNPDNFVISNLNISIIGNICYGVYGKEVLGECHVNDAYDFSKIINGINYAREGKLPLGLFAENIGSIENITLDRHCVNGLELVDGEIIYANMVGGFAGNNIGEVKNLTLLDSDDPQYDVDGNKLSVTNATEYLTGGGKTHINGRTDVGGIIGRESFVVADVPDRSVKLDNLRNYGTVTGLENIGGIVGRAYVHYVGDTKNISDYEAQHYSGNSREEYYKDGYTISDDGVSMSGETVDRASKIVISNCVNRGKISGDKLLYENGIDGYEIREIKTDSDEAENIKHCAFIGGIAGITQDGFMIDSPTVALSEYELFFEKTNKEERILVKDCNSCTLYREEDTDDKKDNDIKSIIDSINTGENEYKPFTCDYYVGGLIGYSRLTAIENCSNKPDDDELLLADNSEMRSFVFGSRYVGGMMGCSDLTRYDVDDPDDDTYACINDSNVVGRMYVGGIAGYFGFSAGSKESFSFRNPSGSVGANGIRTDDNPQQEYLKKYNNAYYEGINPDIHSNTKLLNEGIVLGIKQNKDLGNDITSPDCIHKGRSFIYGFTGFVGGIGGQINTPLKECDNIQSVETKKYMLQLIDWNEKVDAFENNVSVDNLAKVISYSKFGGNCVGGIAGYVGGNGSVNYSNNKILSKVDAIVYGYNIVGGGVGSYDENGNNMCFNIYPCKNDDTSTGMNVLGNDMVGGVIGMTGLKTLNNKDQRNNTLNNNIILDSSYKVIGRYSVGGFAGILRGNSLSDSLVYFDIQMSGDNKVSVEGVAATGGVAGFSDGWNGHSVLSGTIKGVTVNSKLFAGGYLGVFAKRDYDNKNDADLKDMFKKSDSIYIESENIQVGSDDSAFCGGIIGTMSSYSGDCIPFPIDTENSEHSFASYMNKYFYNEGEYVSSDNIDINGVASDILYNDIENTIDAANNMFYNYSIRKSIHHLEGLSLGQSSSVTAKVFAGGLFGYIPEKADFKILDFDNSISVKTTSVIETDGSSELPRDIAVSYLGGVVGRVPLKVSLVNCHNLVSTVSSGEGMPLYEATGNPSYIGGLTEVNAGTIEGKADDRCINSTVFTNQSGGVGAFAGINGTSKTEGTTLDANNEQISSGTIRNCSNTANLSGKYVGGIAATAGGTSELETCYNHGELNASNTNNASAAGAGGILYDVLPAVGQVNVSIYDCVNTGIIRVNADSDEENQGLRADSSAGIAYDTKGLGVINKCRNYGVGLKNGITSDEAGKVAKKINNCFDAADSQNHIGDIVRGDGIDSSNMIKNFYIAKTAGDDGYVDPLGSIEKSDKFVVYRDYGTISSENIFSGSEDYVTGYAYDKKKRVKINDQVLSLDLDKCSKTYSHDTRNGWKMKNGEKNLGFTIFPVDIQNQSRAYADMKDFSIIWDDYYRTEHDEFYKFVDSNDFSDCRKEYNGEKTEDILAFEITTSFKDIAEEEYDNPAYFKYVRNEEGSLKEVINKEEEYQVYYETVYQKMIIEDAAIIAGYSEKEKADYFRNKLYTTEEGWAQIGEAIKYVDGTSWVQVPFYYELYCQKKKNGTYDEAIAGINADVQYSEQLTYKDIADLEYNNLTKNDTNREYDDGYIMSFYNYGEGDAAYNDFERYATSVYGYVKENVEGFDSMNSEEKRQSFLDYLYNYNDSYAEISWTKLDQPMIITYDLIVTSVNSGDSTLESNMYINRVKYDNSSEDPKNMHIAKFDFGNLSAVTSDTYQGCYVDTGFTCEKIKNIQVIIRENGTNDDDRNIGVKALLWSTTADDQTEINDAVMQKAEGDSDYSTASNTSGIMSIIREKGISISPFVVDKEVDENPNYQLRLVYNTSKFSTGIVNITNHPLDNSESGYLSDYSAYNDSIRKVMWKNIDDKYLSFINRYGE